MKSSGPKIGEEIELAALTEWLLVEGEPLDSMALDDV